MATPRAQTGTLSIPSAAVKPIVHHGGMGRAVVGLSMCTYSAFVARCVWVGVGVLRRDVVMRQPFKTHMSIHVHTTSVDNPQTTVQEKHLSRLTRLQRVAPNKILPTKEIHY